MLPMVSPTSLESRGHLGPRSVERDAGKCQGPVVTLSFPLPPGSPGQGRPSWNQRKPGKKLFHAPRIPWRGCHPDPGVQVLGISSYLHVALTVHPLQPSPDSDCSLPFLPPWGTLSDPKTLYQPSLSSCRGHPDLRVLWCPGPREHQGRDQPAGRGRLRSGAASRAQAWSCQPHCPF